MQTTPPIVSPDPAPGATRSAVIVPGVYVCQAVIRGGRVLRIISCDYVPVARGRELARNPVTRPDSAHPS